MHTFEKMSTKDFINRFYVVNGSNNGNMAGTHPQVLLRLAGYFSPIIREYRESNYQMHLDWVVDDSKFRNTFDFESTPLDIAMSETIEWYKQNR